MLVLDGTHPAGFRLDCFDLDVALRKMLDSLLIQ